MIEENLYEGIDFINYPLCSYSIGLHMNLIELIYGVFPNCSLTNSLVKQPF